jgi:hypothetical protein
MFFARRPSLQVIERFGARARELPLSYIPIGIAQDPQKRPSRFLAPPVAVLACLATVDLLVLGRLPSAARCQRKPPLETT